MKNCEHECKIIGAVCLPMSTCPSISVIFQIFSTSFYFLLYFFHYHLCPYTLFYLHPPSFPPPQPPYGFYPLLSKFITPTRFKYLYRCPFKSKQYMLLEKPSHSQQYIFFKTIFFYHILNTNFVTTMQSLTLFTVNTKKNFHL